MKGKVSREEDTKADPAGRGAKERYNLLLTVQQRMGLEGRGRRQRNHQKADACSNPSRSWRTE